MKTDPPLGVKPLHLVLEERIMDVADAISRHKFWLARTDNIQSRTDGNQYMADMAGYGQELVDLEALRAKYEAVWHTIP